MQLLLLSNFTKKNFKIQGKKNMNLLFEQFLILIKYTPC